MIIYWVGDLVQKEKETFLAIHVSAYIENNLSLTSVGSSIVADA